MIYREGKKNVIVFFSIWCLWYKLHNINYMLTILKIQFNVPSMMNERLYLFLRVCEPKRICNSISVQFLSFCWYFLQSYQMNWLKLFLEWDIKSTIIKLSFQWIIPNWKNVNIWWNLMFLGPCRWFDNNMQLVSRRWIVIIYSQLSVHSGKPFSSKIMLALWCAYNLTKNKKLNWIVKL